MPWRLAKSLETLRSQINERHPGRSKVSDGTIGDTAHSARASDHNPNSAGVVQAIDITHDLDGKGSDFDSWKFGETLRLNRDPRLKMVISNGRIFSTPEGIRDPAPSKSLSGPPWTWRPYTGSNKHAHHIHISVANNPKLYDDTTPWKLDPPMSAAIPPAPVVPPPAGVTDDMRHRMARKIIDYEARRDAQGHLAVFRPVDGSYEVAGLNSAHHPKEAAHLKGLVDTGRYAEADRYAEDFILAYTKAATGWVTDAGLEFMLRDCVYNRGPGGAAKILQMALGVHADGEIGQQTRAALAQQAPTMLLPKLRDAREKYERLVLKRDERDHRWKGLVNRWNNSLRDALAFQKEGAAVLPKGTGTGAAGTVVVAGGVAAAKSAGVDWSVILPIAIIALGAVVAGIFLARARR